MNDNTQKLVTVDFIHCLPFELLSLVFRTFPIQDLFECMKVDTLWRYRIQNSPTLWQQITIVDDDDTMLIPKLSSIGSYAKSYKIIDGSEKAHRSSMNLITCGYLNRLQSLGKINNNNKKRSLHVLHLDLDDIFLLALITIIMLHAIYSHP